MALDTLRPTVMGLDNIPAWYLKIGAPFFADPLADMMNIVLIFGAASVEVCLNPPNTKNTNSVLTS